MSFSSRHLAMWHCPVAMIRQYVFGTSRAEKNFDVFAAIPLASGVWMFLVMASTQRVQVQGIPKVGKIARLESGTSTPEVRSPGTLDTARGSGACDSIEAVNY